MIARILCGLAIVSLSFPVSARAEIFDETRCGIEYPKMPSDLTRSPTTVFKSTDRFGISADYFPLVCKGGRTLKVEKEINFPMLPGQVLWPTQTLIFTPSTKGANIDGSNLNPGECSWLILPIKTRSTYELYDATYYPGTKMKAVTKKDAAGRTSTEISLEPKTLDLLLETQSVVVFYVSSLTWATVPFCEQRPLGIHPVPFMRLR